VQRFSTQYAANPFVHERIIAYRLDMQCQYRHDCVDMKNRMPEGFLVYN
jgi:hypothetical protein